MWRKIVVVGVLAVILRHVFIIARSTGLHKTIYSHKPGECKLVPGISAGSEDIALLSDGLALISSGFPPLKDRVKGYPSGHIFAFDYNDDEVKVTKLKVKGSFDPNDLHPHGISVFEDKQNGKTFLFVVNHLLGYDTIEIFQFQKKSMSLEYIRTVRDPLMKSINDVAAVGPREFYFTNDGRSLDSGIRFLEQLMRFRTGGLFHCDVTSCRQLGESMFEPNGIEISRDRRYFFLSQPYEEWIHIYKREKNGYGFEGNKPIQTIPLGTSPDNVFEDDVGDIWIGCHPVGIKTAEHLNDINKVSPSQVIRIKFHPSEEPYHNYELNEVYSEDGQNLTMSTVAVYHNDRLLVGSVRTRLLHCSVAAI